MLHQKHVQFCFCPSQAHIFIESVPTGLCVVRVKTSCRVMSWQPANYVPARNCFRRQISQDLDSRKTTTYGHPLATSLGSCFWTMNRVSPADATLEILSRDIRHGSNALINLGDETHHRLLHDRWLHGVDRA